MIRLSLTDFNFPEDNKESKIDIDRLIKNIDAKIAELDEEEKKLAEEENTKTKATIVSDEKENKENKIDNEKIETESKNDDEFKSYLSSLNNEKFIETEESNPLETKDTPKNIDELIDKIKEQSIQSNNIKPNMNLVEKNKYKEVSDDEFFDDFFD